MNAFFFWVMMAIGINVHAKIYYVSTTGKNSNPGTIDKPFKTLQKISNLRLLPGDIVYIRAGTYKSATSSRSFGNSWMLRNINGSASNPITIAAYPGDFPNGGRVIFDCSDYSHPAGWTNIVVSNCSYLLIKGIRTTGNPQIRAGSVHAGWWLLNNPRGNITLENCESDHIGHNGFRLDNTDNVFYLNCDAHHIDNPFDPGVQHHGGSDGFGRYNTNNTSANTIYRGCRAWFCSDDGWDCFSSPGKVTYENCWSFWNGYAQDIFPLVHTYKGDTWGDGNGFKCGSKDTPPHTNEPWRIFRNCLAFENYNNGFDQNETPVMIHWINNTAYKCGQGGFFQNKEPGNIAHLAKNNIAYQCKWPNNFLNGVIQSNNSWNGKSISDSDFSSLSSAGMNGARQSDGSLPALQFLIPKNNSSLKDIGAVRVMK
jgi:hypothetical protein